MPSRSSAVLGIKAGVLVIHKGVPGLGTGAVEMYCWVFQSVALVVGHSAREDRQRTWQSSPPDGLLCEQWVIVLSSVNFSF